MRVLHLPIVVCNQPWEMSKALNQIGVYSRYMVRDDINAGWLMPGRPDINLNIDHRSSKEWKGKVKWDLRLFFAYALINFNIFHYHSNFPLFDDYSDLRIVKRLGKKIITSYWGCDVRDPALCRKYSFNTCEVCTLQCPVSETKKRLAVFQQYADVQLASMPELLEYVPSAKYFPAFIDSKLWQSHKESKSHHGTWRILHSIGNRKDRGDAKGTKFVLEAVSRLRKEGKKIELISFDKIPNNRMKTYYEKSDIVVEQLRCGWHGVTALEAMAVGKPVVSYIRNDLKHYDPDLPIINANPKTVYRVINNLLLNPKTLLEIGRKSREYIVNHRDSTLMAKKLKKIYSNL